MHTHTHFLCYKHIHLETFKEANKGPLTHKQRDIETQTFTNIVVKDCGTERGRRRGEELGKKRLKDNKREKMIKGKRREDSESEWKTFVTHASVEREREREEKGEQRGRRGEK